MGRKVRTRRGVGDVVGTRAGIPLKSHRGSHKRGKLIKRLYPPHTAARAAWLWRIQRGQTPQGTTPSEPCCGDSIGSCCIANTANTRETIRSRILRDRNDQRASQVFILEHCNLFAETKKGYGDYLFLRIGYESMTGERKK